MTGFRYLAFLAMLIFLTPGLASVSPAPALAVMNLDEPLSDEADEARARNIARNLRCVVCQNQTIDDSEAPLARDMRRLVRERIAAGDSDDAVMGYMTARYGDYVLMRPPFQPNTWALWLGPVAVGLAAVGGIATLVIRRRRLAADERQRFDGPTPALTPREEAALRDLLRDDHRPDNRTDSRGTGDRGNG